jgi:hypothetical protein
MEPITVISVIESTGISIVKVNQNEHKKRSKTRDARDESNGTVM